MVTPHLLERYAYHTGHVLKVAAGGSCAFVVCGHVHDAAVFDAHNLVILAAHIEECEIGHAGLIPRS